ncbi:MAG: DUF5683 domain-containing protein [Bacteroidales bacterium]|nr:DUF5683 domain-containing protein [Bacteroidales bacterium]
MTRIIYIVLLLMAFAAHAQMPDPAALPDSIPMEPKYVDYPDEEAIQVQEFTTEGNRFNILGSDTIPVIAPIDKWAGYNVWEEREVAYNPDPNRAVWMSALFPGLGQVYNRRYWKLPIIVGAYLGLGYATSWNHTMLTDYTRAYRDITDTDPSTKSYMNFFPPTVTESSLDKTWLTNILQSRRNYFRRNRDLCIICMVGVYFLTMVDAYVDASLAHFDISHDLTVDWAPAVFQDGRNRLPSVGLVWAFNF